MATVTVNDVNALIAFAIENNKPALIGAMNATGNPVSSTISDDDLFNSVEKVFTKKGLDGLKVVLSMVPVDKSKVSLTELNNLGARLSGTTSTTAKSGDFWEDIADFFGGTTEIVQVPTTATTTTSPILEPTTIIYLAVGGIIAIVVLLIVFRKSTK